MKFKYTIILATSSIALALGDMQTAICDEPLKATVQLNDIVPVSIKSTAILDDTLPRSSVTSPAINSTDDSTATSAHGNTNVQERIAPLDPLLCPGNYFDEQVAKALLKEQNPVTRFWKKIPDWQAGNWESQQAITTRFIDYVNDKPAHMNETSHIYTCKGIETAGRIRDRNGAIWELFDAGYWTETDHGDYKSCSYIKFSAPGVGEYPDFYAESVSFDVDNKTNKIIAAVQRRSWRRLTYVVSGIIKKEEIHTTYDDKGQPELSAWNTSLLKRTESFVLYDGSLVNEAELLKSFIAYLKSNGLEKLIPTQYTSSAVKNQTGLSSRKKGSNIALKNRGKNTQ